MIPDPDPIRRFGRWWEDGKGCGLVEPAAAALATADGSGRPSVRMVLVRGFGDDGFVFYTNLESRKAREIDANPHAALCLYWGPLGRQVRIEGPVGRVADDLADRYFARRSRWSQIGAWASRQSAALDSPAGLEARAAEVAARFEGGTVPRPPFWSGFRLAPRVIEFWREGEHRLHVREAYRRDGDRWTVQRLQP